MSDHLRTLKDAIKGRPWAYRLWRAVRRVLRRNDRWPSSRELRRHARAVRATDPSFAGEAGHLAGLLGKLRIRGGFLADIAAGDGVTHSGTLFLLRDTHAWRGLAVEADPGQFLRLAAAYGTLDNVALARVRVTPDNITAILRAHDTPRDFEVLDLDLDSYDLFVADALLAEYRPLVITMEVNEKIPPPLDFTVLYHPDHAWAGDHFYGCSIVAACRTVQPHGYILESLEYNNAFFVRTDVAGELRGRDPASAYDAGYRHRPDRRTLFPWNADMEPVLHASAARATQLLHQHFAAYRGRYRLTFADLAQRGLGSADGPGSGS